MTNQQREVMVLHQTILASQFSIAPLFLLTIPKYEVTRREEEPVADVIQWLFRDTGPVITYNHWKELLSRLEHAQIWPDRTYWPPWWPLHHPDWERDWEREVKRLHQILNECLELKQFTRLLFEGMLSLPARHLQLPVFGIRFRAWYIPILYASAPLLPLYHLMSLNLDKLEVSEEEAIAWIVLTSVLTRRKARHISQAMEDFLTFDVPFSLSKESSKSKLGEIISQARIVAFMPLAHAAAQATTLIEHGQFLVALEVALGAGGVTLVLATTFSVAEYILDLPRRKRQG